MISCLEEFDLRCSEPDHLFWQGSGPVTGYSVRYGIQGSECVQTETVSGGAATEVIISRLIDAVTYSIVAAVNSAGTGEYSNPIHALYGHACCNALTH